MSETVKTEKAMKVKTTEIVKEEEEEQTKQPKMKDIKVKKPKKIGLLKDKKKKERIGVIATFKVGGIDRFTPSADEMKQLLGNTDDGVFFTPLSQGTFTVQYVQLCAVVLIKCVPPKLEEVGDACKEDESLKKKLKWRPNCSGGWILRTCYNVKDGKFKQAKLLAEALCWDEKDLHDWIAEMKAKPKTTFMCQAMTKALTTKVKEWRKKALSHNELPESPGSYEILNKVYENKERTKVVAHMKALKGAATQNQNV